MNGTRTMIAPFEASIKRLYSSEPKPIEPEAKIRVASQPANDWAPMIQRHALRADRLEQNGAPVKIEKLLLAAGEPTHVNNLLGVDAHALKGWTVGYRRDD
jgi:hypothetical protein